MSKYTIEIRHCRVMYEKYPNDYTCTKDWKEKELLTSIALSIEKMVVFINNFGNSTIIS